MSTLQVNTINASTSGQAVAVDVQNPRSFRNLFINGAMQVAQRGTSSAVSGTTNGFGSVDRYYVGYNGVNEAPTQEQADISAGTTPYTLGFRKSLKITNGNQTGGADAGDYIFINMPQEAQYLAQSGWNYKSSSSYVTLSFWIKSSVAQNFYFQFDVRDGTRQNYTMETGSLTANTWTKITKVIPGNSNLTIDNDNGVGAYLTFGVFWGTDLTASMSLETWAAANDSIKTPDNTSTWYTTNDSTLEFTGIQLEAGSYATDFEHRSYGDELLRCQRYYYAVKGDTNDQPGISGSAWGSNYVVFTIRHPVEMRANPTFSGTGNCRFQSQNDSAAIAITDMGTSNPPTQFGGLAFSRYGTSGATASAGGNFQFQTDGAELTFSAEL